MKVLFAVSSERISETIIKKYQKEYKEILSYKNVYYFNAILKEIQKDKSYDRIVISEDLEPFSTNNYDSIDKFIFEKLDNISDDAEDIDGNDTSIILICTDRHTKGSEFLVKLFGIGIYNALLGTDRSMENVCKLIKKPRTKKEAKTYYKIDSDDVNYNNKSDKEVNEVEIQNILNHFKKLGRNTSKYSESFANIATQYTDEQLRIIVNCLPINVKAVLEGESPKYQELMSVNGIIPRTYSDSGKKNTDSEKSGISIDFIENNNKPMSGPVVIPSSVRNTKGNKQVRSKAVIDKVNVPSDVTEQRKNRKIIKREAPSEVENSTRKVNSNASRLAAKRENLDTLPNDKKKTRVKSLDEVITNIDSNSIKRENAKKRIVSQKSTKIDSDKNIEEDSKKGRGRPKKEPAPLPFKDNSKKVKRVHEDEEDDSEQEEIFLPGMMDDEVSLNDNYNMLDEDNTVDDYDDDYSDDELVEESNDVKLEYDDTDNDDIELDYYDDEDDTDDTDDVKLNYEEEDDDDSDLDYVDDDGIDEVPLDEEDEYTDEVDLPGLDDLDDDDTILNVDKSTNYSNSDDDEDLLMEFEEDDDNSTTNNNYNNISSQSNQIESIKSKIDYSMSSLNSLLTKDKKIVTFIGTTKNGTSFLVNNLAALFSSCGISTAILDMTKNKNSYYIYTNNEEELRNIAYNSISKLQKGFAEGIQVDKNLAVYTALPNDGKDYSDAESILSTLVQNHSLILIDCDFDTDPAYFASCQEIYLVQSMDILTIQPLTAFLRDLKAKGVLEPEKVRVIINKEIAVKNLSTKAIIGGMSFYNDPAMSFMTELFNKDMVKACSIPFEENVYSKYLDSMAICSISLRGYSKAFINKLKNLGDMVYPLVSKSTYGGKSERPDNHKRKPFSNNVNNTLNQMKKKY